MSWGMIKLKTMLITGVFALGYALLMFKVVSWVI